MTQKGFGLAIGLEEKGADSRIAQYEINYRIPKRDMLEQMAVVLRVSPMNFSPGCSEDIMQTFFWLDEDNPGAINLFQLVRNPGKTNSSDNAAVRYNDNDDWPVHAPVGMYFKYGLVDQFMREWLLRKEELKAGSITRNEYFEWKLGFPQTCDDYGKYEPSVQWKKGG